MNAYIMIIIADILLAANFVFQKKYQSTAGTTLKAGLMYNALTGAFSALMFLIINRFEIRISGYSLVMAAIFSIDIMLFKLLKRVNDGLVFTEISVALIRYISWFCFIICAAFCVLGIYFQLAFIVAFVALVLGTCLRVVKNVIEEATEIKSENDLTV